MGFMGAVVAVNQNFMGWVKISKGEFAFNELLYIDPFLLSAGFTVSHHRPALADIDRGVRQRLLMRAAPRRAAQLSGKDAQINRVS